MARTCLTLALLAIFCIGALADYVEIEIRWDNTIAQTKKNQKAILQEIADELCKIPRAQVGVVAELDKGSLVNTESWGIYVCAPPKTADVGKALTNCNNRGLRKEFMDELEDRTNPDHEAEKITCTLRPGTPPRVIAVAGRKLL